jgi:hypothetical protein
MTTPTPWLARLAHEVAGAKPIGGKLTPSQCTRNALPICRMASPAKIDPWRGPSR